jgi:hypothetical protein
MWNISQAFRNELRSPNQQFAGKATLLSSDFTEIPDGDFFTAGADDFQDYIIDGNVDIDRDRGTRRTAELTLLNPGGNFTPDADANDYNGKFYVNRVVRLYRGIVLGGQTTVYAPIGTFMVDAAETIAERNMSVVNLTLSDMWKKNTKSLVLTEKTYAEGTHVNTVIRECAAWAGSDYPLAPNLDSLSDRTTAEKTLSTKLALKRGESHGDIMKSLAQKFGIDLYCNVEGRLVSQDRREPKDQQEVWHFYSSSNPDQLGMLNSVRKTVSDDNFYNHVYVIGLGDPKNPVIYSRSNNDPTSAGNIDRLGRRPKILESDRWKSQATVDSAGAKLWDKRYNLFEEVTIDVICNPALEADDVIRITEPLAKVNATYRVLQFNVPLTTSKQTIRVTRNYSW